MVSSMGGAGIALGQYDGRVYIAQVVSGGPAAVAGIFQGDELVAIDGYAVQSIPFEVLPSVVQGPAGSWVVLTIRRGAQGPWNVNVIRQPLAPPIPWMSHGLPAQPPPLPSQNPPVMPPPLIPQRPPVPTPLVRPQAAAPQGSPAASRPHLTFQRVVLRDPAVNNVEAFVFLLPQGWQYQGEIAWMHDWAILTNVRLSITDPQTHTTFAYLPVNNFTWFQPLPGLSIQPGQNYMGQMYLPPISDPAQFVDVFWASNVLGHLRGQRPQHIQEVPSLAQEYVRQYGGPAEAHGYRLRYQYEHAGHLWAEEVTFGLLFPPPNQGFMAWYVNFASTVRAPQDILEQMIPVTSAIAGSGESTPEWVASYQVVRQLFRQGLRQSLADTAAFGEQLHQYHAEVARLRQEVAAERAASQDRIAFYRGETLSGVENYTDPLQRQMVTMPAGWRDYWVNERGEYLVSNESSYDPNHQSDVSWRKMARYDPGVR